MDKCRHDVILTAAKARLADPLTPPHEAEALSAAAEAGDPWLMMYASPFVAGRGIRHQIIAAFATTLAACLDALSKRHLGACHVPPVPPA